jgi:hypothetical protein
LIRRKARKSWISILKHLAFKNTLLGLILFMFSQIFFSSNPRKQTPKKFLERQTMTERDSEKPGESEIWVGGGEKIKERSLSNTILQKKHQKE